MSFARRVYPQQLELGRDYILAAATMDHASFIFDTWCSDQAQQSRFRDVAGPVFKVEMRARIERLLDLGKCAVIRPTRNFCLEQGLPYDPAELWGYIAYDWDRQTECPIVHYVYVKHLLRGRGLASTALRDAAGVDGKGRTWWATHTSLAGRKLTKSRQGVYNDFMIETLFARKRPAKPRGS